MLEPYLSNLGTLTEIPASFASRMWPSHQALPVGFVLWYVGASAELVGTAPGMVSQGLLGGILQAEEAGEGAGKVW